MKENNKIESDIFIPKGWKYLPFGDVFEFIQSLALSREQLTLEESEENIYNIHYGDIHATYKANLLDFDKEKRIPKIKGEINLKTETLLKDGDLAIADASEDYEGVAASIEIINLKKRKAIGGLHTFIARDYKGLTVEGFRTYVFKNSIVSIEIKKLATGSKVYGVSKTNLAKLNLLLPPLKEQTKIAKILSTWDIAIEDIEQLIAKKESHKKALMQQLLTGKKRFKEFKGEKWKEYKISDLGISYSGLTGKTKEDFGSGIPFITYMNIFSNRKIDIEVFARVKLKDNEHQNEVKYGDLFFTGSSETPEEVGMSSVLLDSIDTMFLNSFCFGFRLYDFKTLLPEFASFFFRAPHLRLKISILAQGATRYNLPKSKFLDLKIEIPQSIKEQKKIASVLSASYEEIQTLKHTLAHYQQQKKGLMQVLLTGKKRVKI
jgi:type I restriction enzyme S subunit